MRRARSRLSVVTGALLLAACSSDPGTGPAPVPAGPAAAVHVTAGDGQDGLLGFPLRDSLEVRVTDAQGRPVQGATVTFTALAGGSISLRAATTDAAGVMRAAWTLGGTLAAQSARIEVGGVAPVVVHATAAPVPEAVRPMLQGLPAYVDQSAVHMQELLPRNPNMASWIEGKLALLRRPGLVLDVIHDRLWAEGAVGSADGRTLPIVAVFPAAALRGEATESVQHLAHALPLLEGYLGAPFPAAGVRVWQGFVIGMSGGGGALFMEDRASYQARMPASPLPYEASLLHELSHSYVGSESLTQWLELWLFNARRDAGPDAAGWSYTRGWVPMRDANEGVHALLDVQRLVGAEAMQRAVRAAVAMHPPYGQPLPAAVQQRFLDEVPSGLRAQVQAKLAMVRS